MWVVGGVEKTTQRKVFLTTVPRRSRDVLENVIKTFVNPESIIRTDLWRGYNRVSQLGHRYSYQHQTVNHSQGFNINGIHTNTIEGNYFINVLVNANF